MTGESLGHYRVLEKLGQGGMGVVYKAIDTRLDRPVSLKILSPDQVADPERKRRFIQEAKAASALNHPNIVTIYDIGSQNGVDFIAMEFIDGKTLDQLIPRHGMRLNDVLRFAIPIADALDKAHSSGITHRDLKPSNVMVDNSGHVKLLDFGLAKLTDKTDTGEQDLTLTQQAKTDEGMVIGTVSYMSPEQAEGKKIDARSDIFSFGVLLYEMLTGRRPFHGDTPASTLAAVINLPPKPLAELAPETPRDLEKIVMRCLRKERERRFQHISEARVSLEELKEESESGKLSALAPKPVRRRSLAWPALAVAAVLGLAGWGYHVYSRQTAAPAEAKITQLTRDAALSTEPALSPDGKLVAYVSDRSGEGHTDIWVKQVAGGLPVRLTKHPAADYSPVFSADGTIIYFASARDGGGIYSIPALGGDERAVLKQQQNMAGRMKGSPDGAWIAFNPGVFYVGGDTRLALFSTAGGNSKELQTGLRTNVVQGWTSDSKHILIFGANVGRGMTTEGNTRLYAVPVDGGVAIPLQFDRDKSPGAAYELVDDRLLTSPRDTTGAIDEFRIDRSSWKADGPLRRLVNFPGGSVASASAAGGVLVLARPNVISDIWTIPIDAVRGVVTGSARKLTNDEASEVSPTISADGSRMVYCSDRGGQFDIWLRDMATGKETQVTANPETELRARISPDGSKILYEAVKGERHSMHVRDVAGGDARQVCEDCRRPAWAPDSDLVTYYSGDPIRYHSFRLSSGTRTQVLAHPTRIIQAMEFSPDGKWLSFHLPLGGGATQVFIAPVRDGKAAPEAEWILVRDKVRVGFPFWSPDGGLLYMSENLEKLVAQPLEPVTKRPRGPVLSIYLPPPGHRFSSTFAVGFSITRRELILSMGEPRSNLWKMDYKP